MATSPGIWSHSYVAFSGDSEGWEQVGEDEEVADLLTEVAQLERAALGLSADVDADEGSESHRVHVGEVGEVEDDALVSGKELGDRKVEEIGVTGQQFAVTAD